MYLRAFGPEIWQARNLVLPGKCDAFIANHGPNFRIIRGFGLTRLGDAGR
jgi:hypothetical protein